MIQQSIDWHAAFIALWTLLLIMATFIYGGNALHLILGLVPVTVGYALYLFWKTDATKRQSALIAGQILGIALGSTLLAGPGCVLLLLLLWSIAWAALDLPPRTGLILVTGGVLVYLAGGLSYAHHLGELASSILTLLLYTGTFYAAFALLRALAGSQPPGETTIPETTEKDSPAQETQETTPAQAAPAPTAAPVVGETAPEQRPSARPETEPPAGSYEENPLYQDLRVARDIQVSLLLASSPRMPGWETGTSFLPARELGGDLYDFIELDPQHQGVMIGDVTGKGIPAALHMAVARTLFRMEAGRHNRPSEALTQLNRFLIEQIPQGCVTMLYAHLDITEGTLCLSNAGHNYPILLDGSVREISLDGLPLGIDDEYTYSEISARLNPGDTLIFYTDGIVEAINEQQEYFGFDRLYQLLANGNSRRPRTLTRQIVRAVRAFTKGTPQSDDITLVVLRRRYTTPLEEMATVANDVLGLEEGEYIREQLEQMRLPADASPESWRAVILTLGGVARDNWGRGPSRELMQQLFLTLEGL